MSQYYVLLNRYGRVESLMEEGITDPELLKTGHPITDEEASMVTLAQPKSLLSMVEGKLVANSRLHNAPPGNLKKATSTGTIMYP